MFGLLVPEIVKTHPIWSDIGPTDGKNKLKKYVPRNDPKRYGNGSYSFWESWEPVFIAKLLCLYQTQICVLFLIVQSQP